jgi:phosphatidylserine decarboxylase
MAALRQGACPGCPHNIVDPRDLKYYRNVCGYWFPPEADPFQWRERIGFARAGLCELILGSLAAVAGLVGMMAALFNGLSPWAAWPLITVFFWLWLQIAWFFRDPERVIPTDPAALVSPADGTVVDVGEVEDPDFPQGRAFRIGIFLSVFNVHVNRSPRTARVVRLQYCPGRFLNALRPQSAWENEQLWIDLEDTASSRPIRVKQIAGAIARRIVCWLKPGEVLQVGKRVGMIKFGSRTELYLPADTPMEVAVRIGQKVKGGSTILLRFTETSTGDQVGEMNAMKT